VRFKSCWIKGNPEYGFSVKTPIGEIDKILHEERINARGEKVTYEALLREMPDGAFVEMEGRTLLVARANIHGWTPWGYEKGEPLPPGQRVRVLTPRSIVNAFRAGYVVQVSDRSAEDRAVGTPSS
jgi:hypothetical protein